LLVDKDALQGMKTRPIVMFFQMASMLMLLVAVGLLAAITTMHFAIHGAEVEVPSLKGLTVADARRETAGLGLDLDVDNRYYSGEVGAGHILTQSPAPGTVVRREWRVRVSESLGPQKVDVPNTVGDREQVAALELRRAGLEVGASAQLPTEDAAPETVLAQDPPAHAQDIEQPTVNLLVASPETDTPDGYVMPDLVGVPVVTAQMELASVGIKTAPPVYVDAAAHSAGLGTQPATSFKPGSVVGQSPESGFRVDVSTVVRLTVAR
jgi:eukaryotic-like serine/threonine-protein kinase